MIDFKTINSYLEITTPMHLKKIIKFKNMYSYLKKYKGKKVLLIDKSPNYNNFNITQVIFLLSQIGHIDLYYYGVTASSIDKKIDYLIKGNTKLIGEDENYFFKNLRKFNTYRILNKVFNKSINIFNKKSHYNIEYDLVICNGRGFVRDYLEFLDGINYKKIFYFYKQDSGGFFFEYPELLNNRDFINYFKYLIQYELKILNEDNSFDVFNKGGYIFFSKMLSELYRVKNYNNKKYDIVIAGSFRARDFYIINNLLKLRKLKILIITETYDDIIKIRSVLGKKNVDFIINKFSYVNMYKLLSLGKIYLNCSKYGSFSNGITGMLIPCTSETLVISYKNPFFEKVIIDGYNGFLYDSLETLIKKIDYTLSLNNNEYINICKNRLKTFYSGVTIEDILITKVLPKLLE